MKLSSQEVERYARHIVMRDIGGAGQLRLKTAKLLVVGAGGLGSPVLMYLAAAGIGTLGIVDDDVVSLSNLQRQVLFTTLDIGKPKVEAAKMHLNELNPHLNVQTHLFRFTKENAELIADYDLVIDGCDNFATRLLVAQTCERLHKPLLTSAVGVFSGSITTLKPYENNNPRYEDLFPDLPSEGSLPACSTAGIIGALTGVLGSMLALEAVKEVCGLGKGLVGKQLCVETMPWEVYEVSYSRGE